MTSWWATRPRIRRPWTRTPSTSAPRAPSSAVLVASGIGRGAGLAPGGRDQLRRTPGGAGGRVGLVGVVQLDDLDRLVERRGRAAKRIIRIAPIEKFGRDQHAGAGRVRRASRAACRAARRRSRWCRPRRGCRGRCRTRRLSITTSGWVKSTTASAPASTSVVDARRPTSTCGHQLEVLGGLDRRADLGADLAPRAQHADLDPSRSRPQPSVRAPSERPSGGA